MASVDVVLCAFGPEDRVRRAVGRARALAGGRRVLVVPADALVEESLRDVALKADLLPLRGAHGLLAALDRVGGTHPVLVLHDDVHLTPRSLAAMLDAHAAGATLVLPHTNDEGVDHAVGALPLDASDAVLDGARRLAGPARPVRELRPVCVLGAREDLLGLVPFDIASAGALLRVLDDTFVVAGGAVAAHENACMDRQAAADGRPVLVASMIVRDEEEMLPDCLASLAGVVDRVVVCDTGSTDRTIEVARAAGAEVIEREWRDDFAWARNEALDACRDARYVLVIDADERLVCDDPAALRRTLLAAHGEYHAFQVWLDSQDDVEGQRRTRWRFARLFDPNVAHFVGRLHESPRARSGSVAMREANLDGLELHHLGYTPEVFEARDKANRNLAIARAAYDAEHTLHNGLHLARTLEMHPDGHEQAIAIFHEWMPTISEQLTTSVVAYARTAYARALHRAGRLEDALEQAREAAELVPADTGAAVVAAELALALGRADEALVACRRRRETPSLSPVIRRDVVESSLDALEAAALIVTGDASAGLDLARDVLTRAPDALTRWDLIVDAVAADPALEPRLVELAALDTSGRAVAEVLRRSKPVQTARFCLRSLRVGAADLELARVGVVAAMVSGAWDVFDAFAPFVARLAPDVRHDLAERLRARGEPGRAELVAA